MLESIIALCYAMSTLTFIYACFTCILSIASVVITSQLLQDVGTLDSGLNSAVLASNNEFVILPINEPTFGTPRKSQIQTYLEQNEGPGLQAIDSLAAVSEWDNGRG